MFFRQIFEEGLAQGSYIVGDSESGVALVVDPRRDIDVYLRVAEDNELKIVAVTETHIHADYLSGSHELAQATGATLCLSGCGEGEWAYKAPNSGAFRFVRDGDVIEVGEVLVTVRHTPGHTPEHLTFIVSGVIYWWPVFGPSLEGLPRLSIGGQVLYIFLGGMPTVALGAGLTFAPPLYTPYIHAPRVWGLSPAADQQLGGLIMWVPANLAYIVVVSIIFIRWMQAQDAKQRAEEARRYEAGVEEETEEAIDLA